MRPRQLLIASVGAVVALTMTSDHAAAEGRGGDAYIDDTGTPTAEARDSASGGTTRAVRQTNCEWRVVLEDDSDFAIYDESGNQLHSETGRWLERWCDGRQVLVGDSYAVPEGVRGADPAGLALEARESVPIPAPPIFTSPDADRKLYSRVRTWLWLAPDWWRGYSATAEAGGVSSTVSARPVRATWAMGDGGTTVCEGPGVEWRSGMADDETYCSYVYTDSSDGREGGTYTLTVTVEFEVSWSSNVGGGGALARITRSASRPVRVGEIQAVETE